MDRVYTLAWIFTFVLSLRVAEVRAQAPISAKPASVSQPASASQPSASQPSASQPASASQPSASQPSSPGVHRFHLLFTSDIYGRFAWPGCEKREPERADLSHLIGAINEKRQALRKEGEEPLVVAAGSTIRPDVLGSFVFSKNRGGPAIALLKQAGFHAISVGPYDFGAHPDALKSYLERMAREKVALQAANVFCNDADDFRCRHLGWKGKRYRVLQKRVAGTSKDFFRVGIFSVVREDLPKRILGRSVGSLYTKDPVAESRRLIRHLRGKERVDLVIVMANLNLESNAPEPVLTFVRKLGRRDAPDLVIADGMFYRKSQDFITHIRSKVGPVILGTDRFGQHLGHAVIRYRKVLGRVELQGTRVQVAPVHAVPPDPVAVPLVELMLRAMCSALHQPLGRARLLSPMSLGGFIRYLMEIMRTRSGAELAALNDSALADTSFPMEGVLTREKLLRGIRTATDLGAFWITGERLKKVLGPHITGAKKGLNVLGLTKKGLKWYVNSRPLLSGLHYKVATTRFVAEGGDGLISLRAERFRESGRSLRRAAVDFFKENRQAAVDNKPDVDLERDFSDPWEEWMLYGGSSIGLFLSDVSVGNGANGSRYSQPLLKRDNVTALKLDVRVDFGASNRNHRLEGDLSLQYGQTWTLTAEDKAADRDATTAETLDRIRGDVLYSSSLLRNLKEPGRWYIPLPYAEATLITEFTKSGCSPSCKARAGDGEEPDYRYLDLGGTLGVGILPHPNLFVKAGLSFAGELLTPDDAKTEDNRVGLYLGYKLRRIKLVSDVRRPLQLESRFDYFVTDLTGALRQELTLESKILFSLTPYLHVTASHNLYVFDTRCTTEPCVIGANETSVSSDLSLGLEVLLDYRHQMF